MPLTARAPAGRRNAHGDHDGTRTPRNTPRPAVRRRSPRQRTLVLAAMCLALVLVIAGVSMLAVGLPSVGEDLGLSQTSLTWVADSYALTLASLLLFAGALGDRYGRRGALLVGIVAVRCRLAAVGVRRLRRAAHRLPGADRPRRRADHAGHPVDHHERVPARGAGPGGRHLGRLRRGRRHARDAGRGLDARRVLVAVDLLRHRRGRRRSPSSSSSPSCRPAAPSEHVGLDPLGTVLSALGIGALVLGIIEGPIRGLDRAAHRRPRSSPAPCWPSRSCAGSCGPSTRCSTPGCSATAASPSARPRCWCCSSRCSACSW